MDELARRAEQQRQEKLLEQKNASHLTQLSDSQRLVGLAVIEGAKAQIKAHDHIAKRPQKTEIVNPQTPISMAVTNLNVTAFKGKDADKLAKKLDVQIDAIHKLSKSISNQPAPEAVHDLTVNNLDDLVPVLEEVRDSVRGLQLKSPDVHVPAPVVSVAAPDMSIISDYLDNIDRKLSTMKMPKFDTSPIVEAFADFKQFIGGLSMPSSGSSGGNTAKGFIDVPFDEVDITSYTANNDPAIVIYKRAGATVATLTITYDVSNRITKVVKS